MENKKNKLFEEHLRKIKYRYDYKINESPKYRPLVDNNEEFDNLPVELYNTDNGQAVPASPNFTNEVGDQENTQKPEGNEPPEPTNSDAPAGLGEPKPAPDAGDNEEFPTEA